MSPLVRYSMVRSVFVQNLVASFSADMEAASSRRDPVSKSMSNEALSDTAKLVLSEIRWLQSGAM